MITPWKVTPRWMTANFVPADGFEEYPNAA